MIRETSLPALTAPLSFDPDARQSRYPYPRGNLHESAAGKAGAMTPQSLRTAFDKETGRLAPRTAQKLTAFTSHHDSGQFFSFFLRKPRFDALQSQGYNKRKTNHLQLRIADGSFFGRRCIHRQYPTALCKPLERGSNNYYSMLRKRYQC